ncbi:MAG: 30S ribosome-binding factor RbfA [Chitinispirillaceae bacterium]|jgi:ribosome-binding factor A|nr:30S ribosome-binding factor RbfA [Chitinispirillaceae bacterium]
MPAPQFHHQRLREQLRLEIGLVIAQEMRDPRIPPVVTITEVRLAQDNRDATVLVSIYGDETVKGKAVAALTAATAFIQRTVAGRVSMKHFPKLHFKLDKSIEYGQHINDLLKEVRDDLA